MLAPLRNTPRKALVTFGVKKLSPCVAGNALEEPDPSNRNTGINRSATGISPLSVHSQKRESSFPGQAIPTLINQASRVERGNTEEKEKAIPVLPSTHVEDSQSTDRPPSGLHSSQIPPQYQYPAPNHGASYAESSYGYPSSCYEYSGPPPSYYYPPPSHWPSAANPPQGEELVQTVSYAPAPPLLEHRPAPSLIQIATTGEISALGTLRGRRASSDTAGQRSQQAWSLPTSSVLPAASSETERPNIAAASAARPAKRPLMSLPRPVSAGRGLSGTQPST